MAGDRGKFPVGVDGNPTDPNHPWTKNVTDPETARAEWIRRELRGFENAWRAGSLHAILDAAAFCGEVKIPPPPWLVIAIETLVARQLLVRSGRGRFNSRQAVFNENQKHYLRWDMVRELHERGRELYEERYELKKRFPKRYKDLETDIGLTLEKAFATVANELKGTDAEGGEDAIKKSYRLVEGRMAEGGGAEFYLPRFKPTVKPG